MIGLLILIRLIGYGLYMLPVVELYSLEAAAADGPTEGSIR